MAEDSTRCAHLGQPTQAYGVGTATAGPFMCPWCEIDRLRAREAELLAQIESMRTGLDDALDKVRRRL